MNKFLNTLYTNLAGMLPNELLSCCFIHVVAATTTGKYGNTIVPKLGAVEALERWSRIHGLGGAGEDEFYDSNRNRK